MFNQLIETEDQVTEVKTRRNYFILSAIAMFTTLFAALIISLFAIDLNLGMGDLDMAELVAPIDVTDQKLPETEIAPKSQPKGGPSQTASRQVSMARIDESPSVVPTAVSTAKNNVKERPSLANYQIGKFDSESDQIGGEGSGRGDGTGPGTGDGDGLSTEVVATKDDSSEPPPPPIKKTPLAPVKPIVQSMGVVNGRATSLPRPEYSAAAKAVNALGTVSVSVLIDEKGQVVSANAVSGNELLRQAAELAARSAKFSPTLLSGVPIKIKGVINYNFSG